jgi:hypothetical protein
MGNVALKRVAEERRAAERKRARRAAEKKRAAEEEARLAAEKKRRAVISVITKLGKHVKPNPQRNFRTRQSLVQRNFKELKRLFPQILDRIQLFVTGIKTRQSLVPRLFKDDDKYRLEGPILNHMSLLTEWCVSKYGDKFEVTSDKTEISFISRAK